MPLSRAVSSSAISCSLAATRYAGCSVATASCSTVTGVSTTSSSASSAAPSSESSSSGAVATSMPRSRSVGNSAGMSSVISVFYFHRILGCQVFVGWPISGPRNLEHTKRF